MLIVYRYDYKAKYTLRGTLYRNDDQPLFTFTLNAENRLCNLSTDLFPKIMQGVKQYTYVERLKLDKLQTMVFHF